MAGIPIICDPLPELSHRVEPGGVPIRVSNYSS